MDFLTVLGEDVRDEGVWVVGLCSELSCGWRLAAFSLCPHVTSLSSASVCGGSGLAGGNGFIKTLILSVQGPPLLTSFNLSYFLSDAFSKYGLL